MILQNRIENEVVTSGVIQENIKMGLDADSTAHLMMLLSTNLYSDNIGTPIQEILSNALDSTVEAGSNEPIIASLVRNSAGNWEFHSTDYGSGLDDEDFRNIMSKYGKSTKRQSVDSLGFMGIGSKSMFAYTNTYSYICRKAGIERMYVMRKDDVGFAIDLIYEKPTDERNGVKVIVPVKDNDYGDFKEKILEKTAYFEQVYFEIRDRSYYSISNEKMLEDLNDFVIIDTPHFKLSSLDDSGEVKILLGRINYNLDFSKLGISRFTLPLALKFSLSEGLFPSPNREGVLYNTESKILILNRIKSSIEYLVAKYNSEVGQINSLKEILDYYSKDKQVKIESKGFSQTYYLNHLIQGYKSVVNALQKLSSDYDDLSENIHVVEPTWDKLKYLTCEEIYDKSEYLLKHISVISRVDGYGFTTKLTENRYREGNRGEHALNTILNTKTRFISVPQGKSINRGKLVDYIRDTYQNVEFVRVDKNFYKLKSNYVHGGSRSYHDILKLQNHPKSEWRQRIIEWQSIVKELEDQIIPLESIEISQEWLDARKKENQRSRVNSTERKLIGKQEINLKIGRSLEKWSHDWNCKFVGNSMTIENIYKNSFLTVYGTEEQRKQLDSLYLIANSAWIAKKCKFSGQLKVAILGQRDIEKIKNLEIHNLKSIEAFMSENGKLIGKYVTAYKVNKFLGSNSRVLNQEVFISKNISKSLIQDVDSLKEFKNRYNNISNYNVNNEFHKALFDLVEENKWEDKEIIAIQNRVEKQLKKLDFIKFFKTSRYSERLENEKELIPFVHEVLKGRKFKMDYIHYDSPSKRTLSNQPLEEVSTED